MSTSQPRITCIGLANVDVIASASDEFLAAHGIKKGASTLLDAITTGIILSKLQNATFYPGGCAANVACGIALHGQRVRFCGTTGDDSYADIFRTGFAPYPELLYDTPIVPQKMTSVCLTLITPDKDRSFAFCGDTAGWHLRPSDLPFLASEATVYLEANLALMKAPGQRTVMEEAIARAGQAYIVVNYNDTEVIAATRPLLRDLIPSISCVVGNMEEMFSLFEVRDFAAVRECARSTGKLFAITDGPEGAYLIRGDALQHFQAEEIPPSRIVNTVGAGDQFAAGLIAGLVSGMDEASACRQGIRAASAVIQEVSGRPKRRPALTSHLP